MKLDGIIVKMINFEISMILYFIHVYLWLFICQTSTFLLKIRSLYIRTYSCVEITSNLMAETGRWACNFELAKKGMMEKGNVSVACRNRESKTGKEEKGKHRLSRDNK